MIQAADGRHLIQGSPKNNSNSHNNNNSSNNNNKGEQEQEQEHHQPIFPIPLSSRFTKIKE